MKNLLKEYKNKIIISAVILAVLAGAFFWGGNYPKPGGGAVISAAVVSPSPSPSASESASASLSPSPAAPSASPSGPPDGELPAAETAKPSAPPEAYSSVPTSPSMVIDPVTGKDQYLTDPVPEGKPVPVEPQDAVIGDKATTCTLSVRCDTILNNIDLLDQEKWELVPADGIIFAAATVTFYEGESVFDVLRREMKKAKIQMEFENTPLYNSAYIEGIDNLYEFDVGELSGWMYRVNDWFPNYGCSRYQLKEGDVVEWLYTCDLGRDIGGSNAIGG